ncbi:MAG: GFA family protein [Burkholderiales bacterium]
MSDSTANPLPALTGGCLCGRVRYEATPDHRDGYYCHCRMCQLAFGNTRAAFLNLRKAEVRWLSMPAYYASSKIARRGFCSQCGTPLTFEYLDSERMDLAAGSLDDPSLLKPTAHFAIESRVASWHAEDGLPGERLDANERINNRWRAAYGDGAAPGLATARDG